MIFAKLAGQKLLDSEPSPLPFMPDVSEILETYICAAP